MTATGLLRFTVRQAGADDAAAVEELRRSAAGASICPRTACTLAACASCPPANIDRTAFVATLPAGQIIGAAWIDSCKGDPQRAHLGLLVVQQYQAEGIEQSLLAQVVIRARERGILRLTACVFHDPRDALRLFRAAGLQLVSSLSVGGISEVVLEIGPP